MNKRSYSPFLALSVVLASGLLVGFHRNNLLLAGTSSTLGAGGPDGGEQVDVQHMVEAVLARGGMPFSGRMDYTLTSGFKNTGKVINTEEVHLSFSGSSWARRYPAQGPYGQEGARISHKGKLIEYIGSPGAEGGQGLNRAHVGEAEAIDKNFPSPPVF